MLWKILKVTMGIMVPGTIIITKVFHSRMVILIMMVIMVVTMATIMILLTTTILMAMRDTLQQFPIMDEEIIRTNKIQMNTIFINNNQVEQRNSLTLAMVGSNQRVTIADLKPEMVGTPDTLPAVKVPVALHGVDVSCQDIPVVYQPMTTT